MISELVLVGSFVTDLVASALRPNSLSYSPKKVELGLIVAVAT